MGSSGYNQIQISKCDNCGKESMCGCGSSEWNHNANVCSPVCGRHLHQKIKNGMVDGNNYTGYFDICSSRNLDDKERMLDLRIRINQLKHRLKNGR